MRYHTWKLFQMTAKCLIRDKAFLIFVLILPILATLILNVKGTGAVISKEGQITKLKDLDSQVAYCNDYSMMPVKVYDQSESEITDDLLKELYQTGMFQIYHVDATKVSKDTIVKSAKWTADKDKVGAIIVLGKDLEQNLLNGEAKDITVFKVGDDKRYEMLYSSMENTLNKYAVLGKKSGSIKKLQSAIKNELPKEIDYKEAKVNDGKSILGMDVNYNKTDVLGGVLAVMTIAFMISGVLILNTILKERDNLVFTRILLTNASNVSYLLSKFIIVIFTSLIQTVVATASYWLFVKEDVGINCFQFGFIVFLLGILFNFISVCIGIYVGSSMTALYLSFIVWVITALLGGMYFDISSSSDVFQGVAMLMPQRWGLKAASLFMTGNEQAYPVLLLVTAAYLIVIMVASIIGIRMNRKE